MGPLGDGDLPLKLSPLTYSCQASSSSFSRSFCFLLQEAFLDCPNLVVVLLLGPTEALYPAPPFRQFLSI